MQLKMRIKGKYELKETYENYLIRAEDIIKNLNFSQQSEDTGTQV